MSAINLQNYSLAMRLCKRFFGNRAKKNIARKFHLANTKNQKSMLKFLLLLQRPDRQLDVTLQKYNHSSRGNRKRE